MAAATKLEDKSIWEDGEVSSAAFGAHRILLIMLRLVDIHAKYRSIGDWFLDRNRLTKHSVSNCQVMPVLYVRTDFLYSIAQKETKLRLQSWL